MKIKTGSRAGKTLVAGMLVLGFVLAALGSARAETVISRGTTGGVFLRVDTGDYAHLVIRDGSGKEQSFFVMRTSDATLKSAVETPARYRGWTVKVTWQDVKRHIPEAGGMMRIREATRLKLVAPGKKTP